LVTLGSIGQAQEYYTYYYGLTPVYRSLYEIKPFFEYTRVVKSAWKRPEPELIKLRDGIEPVVLVHGIDPDEIYGVWTVYKKMLTDSWKKFLPEEYGLYIFLYPSLDIPLEEIANALVKQISNLSYKVNIYAHSMGGIVVRYALQDEKFRESVSKVVFAGTPHIGSPLANFVVMDKSILKLHPKYDIIRPVLLSANISGVFIEAPNYKYISVGFNNPDIPNGVEFLNFAGFVISDLSKMILNLVETEIFSTTALYVLNAVVKTLYPEDSIYVQNDGMVPLASAIYYGKEKVFPMYDHADLAFSEKVVKEAINYFYRPNNEN